MAAFFARYPEFAVSSPAALAVEGSGTYAYFHKEAGVKARDYYQKLGLTVNRDASFPWLYHGPWVPFNDPRYFPIAESRGADFTWLNCDPAGHGGHAIANYTNTCTNYSDALLHDWYGALKHNLGVQTLVYGTVDEYGMGIRTDGTLPEGCDEATPLVGLIADTAHPSDAYQKALECGANRLLRDRFPTAVLRDPKNHGNPIRAAWDSVIVDWGDAGYAELLLNNTRRVATQFSGTSGVALDRGDYFGALNGGADDGVSMYNLTASRAVLNSWRFLSPKMSGILRGANQSLWVNSDMGHRIDMWEFVDGVIEEIGDNQIYKTGAAWLASGGKPAWMWCHEPGERAPCGKLMTEGDDPDRHCYLQSHVHMGVYPSVPFPLNDHMILPGPRIDAFYAMYAPVFKALVGKRMAFEAHAVTGAHGRYNAFEMRPFGSGRYAFTVTDAPADANEATIWVAVQALVQRGGAIAQAVAPVPATPAGRAEAARVARYAADPGLATLPKSQDGKPLQVKVPVVSGAGVVIIQAGR